MSDYGNLMGKACPGTLGDSSLHNIDGACYVSDETENILCGKFVRVLSNDGGYREITDRFPNKAAIPYGVAFRSQYDARRNLDGYLSYFTGDPINVVNHGRVWVLTQKIDSAPQFGSEVYVTTDGFASQDKADFEIYGWTFTGGHAKFNGVFWIVEVQIARNVAFLIGNDRKLVNGCMLHPNKPSPQASNIVVDITAQVSPVDADNPLGNWSVSDDTIATVIDAGQNSIVLMPTGKPGRVHVHWEAQDGSGVQASIPYDFT